MDGKNFEAVSREEVHAIGAKKHGLLWLKANEQAVKACEYWGFDFRKNGEVVSTIVLFVLETLSADNAEGDK